MRVLSIDLDYIMGPTIEIYNSAEFHSNPVLRWENFFKRTDFDENSFFIDQGALIYCYDLFLKSLKNNPTVVFGYEHDQILYQIGNLENIDLINIDHHDDVMHGGGSKDLMAEYKNLCKYDEVCEGNWIAWLHSKGQLNSAVWICNKNSSNLGRNRFNQDLLGDKYSTFTRDAYDFDDYNFDHVFICLSPQYMPPRYWHYFTMFMIVYEEITGNDINFITNRKYGYDRKFDKTTERILR